MGVAANATPLINQSLNRTNLERHPLKEHPGPNGLVELGEQRTWKFFIQILLALHVIHEKGIVHADLKPSNLLIAGRDYDLKLTDFGVSLPLHSSHA